MPKLTPAEYVIEVFGGVRATARAIGYDPSSVSRWKRTGKIPSASQPRLLDAAKKSGLKLSPHALILGHVV